MSRKGHLPRESQPKAILFEQQKCHLLMQVPLVNVNLGAQLHLYPFTMAESGRHVCPPSPHGFGLQTSEGNSELVSGMGKNFRG